MDLLTPSLVTAADLLNGTKCDGTEITKNLFKDHKPSIVGNDSKRQKLETYLRIRSVDKSEPKDRQQYYQMVDDHTLLAKPPATSNASREGPKRFNFSKIFDENAGQSVVYDSCGLPIVKRFLGGNNGLLFAYGITSSGKSYTMRGSALQPGVIPRALNTIFEVIGHRVDKSVPLLRPDSFTNCCKLSDGQRQLDDSIRQFIFDQNDKSIEMGSFRSQISVLNEHSNQSLVWNDVLHSTFRSEESKIKCWVWISFYEIYNEELFDLLDLEIEGEKKPKPMLFKDESDNYFVRNLRQISVSSAEEAYKVLLFGQNNLHISATNLNKNSSRSHCAFTISLITTQSGLCSKRSPYNMNHLSICDLAGAERSEKANNTGRRIREAGKINGSLLSLSRVISAVRHNQKFEHEPSKQRFVNYRDSKLTKIFQPFFTGSGVAAMISTMNPSLNLFDETYFALKFTGVASQLMVSSEDQRNRFHDSLKRLTQLWMQSSQRWSNFAHLKPSKPSVSIIQAIQEEDEENDAESDDGLMNVTAEDFERKVAEITQMDLSRADPQEIEVLRTQIDFLVEKLKQTETDKIEMEMEVRKQVVSEFNKMIADMEEMADNKDKAKKKLEEMMTNRLINNENLHKQEKLELEHKLSSLQTENFTITEELCKTRDELCISREELKEFKANIEEMSQRINELESQLDSMDTSAPAVKSEHKDASTSTEAHEYEIVCVKNETIEANTSCTDLRQVIDANTSAVDLCDHSVPKVETTDQQMSTSIHLSDGNTSTTGLIQCKNETTNTSVKGANKSISVNTSLIISEDKQTLTEESPPIIETEKTLVNTSVSPMKDLINDDKFEKLYKQQLESYKQLETALKEKDAVIDYHQKVSSTRDKRLAELEEEVKRLKTNSDLNNLTQLLKSSKPSSIASSVTSVSTKSVASEDTISTAGSIDSFTDKPKKSGKYSSRKRKPAADNSSDKRYLQSINDVQDDTVEEPAVKSSQTSVASSESKDDEIGCSVFSVKKKNNKPKNKRKGDHCYENEVNYYHNDDLCKRPESKRKRPPLQNLYCSPISPIVSVERVTRSKAKRSLKY